MAVVPFVLQGLFVNPDSILVHVHSVSIYQLPPNVTENLSGARRNSSPGQFNRLDPLDFWLNTPTRESLIITFKSNHYQNENPILNSIDYRNNSFPELGSTRGFLTRILGLRRFMNAMTAHTDINVDLQHLTLSLVWPKSTTATLIRLLVRSAIHTLVNIVPRVQENLENWFFTKSL